ncbi:CtsR family transcriptional regulator [Geosporobacter ferrireducens]|uniref:Transcriptional regulator CtsR n=1 Tax=Geosporobacter ferrireducens TaxID=1424294 RepID=A0A1D8GJM6_9FIRM|nr:CtsR family transcriptional regulator [Geosporobacter ferrireducens]AOT71115.1 CtsR family transcriptional regulator [Geosporobacter ferrireducens]MTI57924.1 CtsR family transcriptional regulator [Geosporobacter ferrireducens]
MSRITDIIEGFIKELLEEANNQAIEIQRNELANYFNCAPSQINYVLTTRFTLDKGYVIESRRGGGGYIKIIQLNIDKNQLLRMLLEETNEAISMMRAAAMIGMLKEKGFINDREARIMAAALSDRSINVPMNIKDTVRAGILKNILMVLFN